MCFDWLKAQVLAYGGKWQEISSLEPHYFDYIVNFVTKETI